MDDPDLVIDAGDMINDAVNFISTLGIGMSGFVVINPRVGIFFKDQPIRNRYGTFYMS